MATKTVVVSDRSGEEIVTGQGARVTIVFEDQRKPIRELDLSAAEAEQLGGRPVKRRGRQPSSIKREA